ncbi:MAG: site-2 protease family protein [Planctomycetota bacterium]|jgi:Zn-dependent protease
MEDAGRIFVIILALGFSVILHEMAHAWSALKLGDPTGRDDNRLSWNPIYHIDPFMTILLPGLLLLASGGTFAFGGAKPVRINPFNFRNPGKGMMLSAAAGPACNFLQAIVTFGILLLLAAFLPGVIAGKDAAGGTVPTLGGFFLIWMIQINLILGAFNLIPIPPLDGSRILRYLLPRNAKATLDSIEPFGLFIIFGLLWIGGLNLLLAPVNLLFQQIMIVVNMVYTGG